MDCMFGSNNRTSESPFGDVAVWRCEDNDRETSGRQNGNRGHQTNIGRRMWCVRKETRAEATSASQGDVLASLDVRKCGAVCGWIQSDAQSPHFGNSGGQ